MFLISIFTGLLAYYYGYTKGLDSGTNKLTSVTTEYERSILINEYDTFTNDKLKEYLVKLNVKYPHIAYAQSVLETGNFKSHVFKSNQNLFGMKEARRRATTNAGTENGHAMYGHWRESVIDYALFQCAFLLKLNSEDAYYQYLSENYAEAPDYVSKVKKLAEKYKQGLI